MPDATPANAAGWLGVDFIQNRFDKIPSVTFFENIRNGYTSQGLFPIGWYANHPQ